MKKIFLTGVVFFLLLSGLTFACDFCFISQGISPLDTLTGTGIKINERYTLLNSVYNGTNEAANPGAKEEYWTTEITGFYSMSDNIVFLLVAPFKKTKLYGHLHVHDDGKVEIHQDMTGEETGLGDIMLLFRYKFFKTYTANTSTNIAGLLGIKFPTGKTDGRTDNGNEYLDSHLQLGTGSTDIVLGLSLSHSLENFFLSTNLLGVITKEGEVGDKRHQFGNMVNYDFTTKYRIYPNMFAPSDPQFFFSLGVKGELRERENENGVELANSGGHTIYLSPGIQIVLATRWTFELSYQNPIYHHLYGTQLGEDYKMVGGITYLF